MKMLSIAMLAILCACTSQTAEQSPHVAAASSVQAGEYIVRMAGCNGCHTPGWDQSDGKLPSSQWLTGNSVGYRGPWGVVYPVNVRLFAASMPRSAWTELFKSAPRLPVMPFMDYGHGRMSDTDVGAMYDFIISLGKAGKPAPSNLGAGQTPTTPYINFIPQQPARAHVSSSGRNI